MLILAIILILAGFGVWAYGQFRPDVLPAWAPTASAILSGLVALILLLGRVLAALDISIRDLWRATARPSGPCQAPRPLAEFVGRRGEIERLTKALKPGGRAAITGVVGMGGIGKTELAKFVAHQVKGRYHDGVLWADCGQERLADIADRWATEYDVKKLPGDDLASKASSWRGVIGDKEVLLVFDNVQPGQEIEPFFPPDGRSTVLITTRHEDHPALRDIEPLRLDQFTPAEAMALAEKVLGREEARKQRGDAERLFELVGYLPLAVHIALRLAQVNGWSLKELNRVLEKAGAIKVLKDPERAKKSLRATFQTAWENLPDELQRAFSALAIFNQGPSFDTQAMAAALEAEEPAARALLNRLDGRSLLTKVGDGRWSLHPLLREFAAGKLSSEDPAWARMAAHYAEVAGYANELYKRGHEDLLRGLALFDLEWPHIRAGHDWAMQHAEAEEATRLCSAYPDAAVYCLRLRLHPWECIVWLEPAIQAARRLGDRKAEGAHLRHLGLAYHRQGEAKKSIVFYQKALEIDREIRNRQGEEADLDCLGIAHLTLGKYRKAIKHYQKALEIARKIDDRRGEGVHLGNLGFAYYRLGEAGKAIEYCEDALKIAREIGDRRGEGIRLGNLGLAYTDLGEVRKATGYLEQALEIAREIRDRRGEGRWMGGLGDAYRHLGEVRKAIRYCQKALEIAKEIGDRRGEGNDLANMGQAYKRLGNKAKAKELWEEALRIFEEIEDPHTEMVREWLAELEG